MSEAGRGTGENSALAAEVQELLRRLVAFDTVNPPGNERPAQEHLAGAARRRRLRVRAARGRARAAPTSWRGCAAEREGPTLCYLGHVDTVLAEPSEWSHDPWSGDLADGYLWGRGALDMKSQVAAEIAAAVSLARSGWRPARGELLIVAVVDEETGGELGAEWITKHPPREGPLRPARQRGRRRRVRVPRPSPLRGLLRREGRLPLHRRHRGRRRPRLDAEDRRERPAEDGSAARAPRPRASPPTS